MPGIRAATPLPLLAALALTACASSGSPASFVNPVEDTVPLTTRYDFQFDCPYAGTVRIAAQMRWIEGQGYRSRIDGLRIGRKTVGTRWIDELNERMPAGAYQERPWLTCSGDGALIELRFIDRSNGSVALSPRIAFRLTGDGTLTFND